MTEENKETQQKKEPPDNHIYSMVVLNPDTIRFLIESVKFVLGLIEHDIKELESDDLLKLLVPEHDRKQLTIYNEKNVASLALDWLNKTVAEQGEVAFNYHLAGVQHYFARYIKSCGLIYLQELKQKRNIFSARSNITKQAVQTVDERISMYEAKLQGGIFAGATPIPFLADQFLTVDPQSEPTTAPTTPLAQVTRPRPVVLDSIQLLDDELHRRCIDLFDRFSTGDQLDRLDTVVMEATKLLEERIRGTVNAPAEYIGIKLADYAFSGDNPRLVLSDIKSEQDAAHLLFRGVFGFIRNPAHHRRLGELVPDRVLQTLGFIDYLLGLLENADTRQA